MSEIGLGRILGTGLRIAELIAVGTCAACGSGAPAVPGSYEAHATQTARVQQGLSPDKPDASLGPVPQVTPEQPPSESFTGPLSESANGGTSNQTTENGVATTEGTPIPPARPLTPGTPQIENGTLIDPLSGISFPLAQDPTDPDNKDGEAKMCATIAEHYVAADPAKGIVEKPETVFRVIESFGGGVYSAAGTVTIYTADGQSIEINPRMEMPPKTLKYKPLQVVVCRDK